MGKELQVQTNPSKPFTAVIMRHQEMDASPELGPVCVQVQHKSTFINQAVSSPYREGITLLYFLTDPTDHRVFKNNARHDNMKLINLTISFLLAPIAAKQLLYKAWPGNSGHLHERQIEFCTGPGYTCKSQCGSNYIGCPGSVYCYEKGSGHTCCGNGKQNADFALTLAYSRLGTTVVPRL